MQKDQNLLCLSSAECEVKAKRDRRLFSDILQFAVQKEFRSELAENAVEALIPFPLRTAMHSILLIHIP